MRGRWRGLVRWVVRVAAIDLEAVGTLCASASGDASGTLAATITGIRRRRQRRVLAAGRHLRLLSLVGYWGVLERPIRNETPTSR